MITWAQVGLQDAASPVMEELVFFHDFTMVVLVFIVRFVGYIIGQLPRSKWLDASLLEGQAIECVWTLVPALILVQVAIPSLLLLYLLDESSRCGIRLKALGHQ